jgi:hypothetical protein
MGEKRFARSDFSDDRRQDYSFVYGLPQRELDMSQRQNGRRRDNEAA